MHPVFVEAVKKNQIGVAPQEPSFLVSTAPGTIPATVRPPRIPELANAPVVAGTRLDAGYLGRGRAARDGHCRDQTRCPAGRQVERQQPVRQPVRRRNRPKPSRNKSDGTLERMARLVGLRGNDAEHQDSGDPATRAETEAARPSRPAWPRMVRSAPGRPRPNRSRPPKRKPRPLLPLQPPAQAAVAAPASTAMSGAAPVVQTGNFDSRWSGFR